MLPSSLCPYISSVTLSIIPYPVTLYNTPSPCGRGGSRRFALILDTPVVLCMPP